MTKMKISGKQWRWLALLVVAAVVLLIRLFHREWLKGKNPLLIIIIFIAVFLLYRFSKTKSSR